MEHLIEQIVWLQDKDLTRGYVFGVVHTVIPLIGFYTGWSINRFLKIVQNLKKLKPGQLDKLNIEVKKSKLKRNFKKGIF